MKEKKIYNQELEEETKRRLLEIRSQKQSKIQEQSEITKVKKENESIQQIQDQQPGLKKKIFYYLTLGYKKY